MEPKKTPAAKSANAPKIVWNDANMRSQYANVTSVVGGREEIILLFGLNQAWKPGQEEVKVDINERMVLSPFAAKRLALLLGNALTAYEKTFGNIDIGVGNPQG